MKNNGKKEQTDLRETTQLNERKPAIMWPSVSVIAWDNCGEASILLHWLWEFLIMKTPLARHVYGFVSECVRVCVCVCAQASVCIHLCTPLCVIESRCAVGGKKSCRLFIDIFDRRIQKAKANVHTLAILQQDKTEGKRERERGSRGLIHSSTRGWGLRLRPLRWYYQWN